LNPVLDLLRTLVIGFIVMGLLPTLFDASLLALDVGATIVTRILDAGATIVGKAHCEYFCL
jgi:hypothetical protein